MTEKTLVMNDETLHRAIMKANEKLKHYPEHRTFLFRIRDDITDAVRSCGTNIEVIIYVDDVLDEPIKCKIGAGENRLRITIQGNGKVTGKWTDETWSKVFKDVGTVISDLMKKVVKAFKICSTTGDVEAIEAVNKGAIGYK